MRSAVRPKPIPRSGALSGPFWQRYPVLADVGASAPATMQSVQSPLALLPGAQHPLAETAQTDGLRQRALEIDAAFTRIEPALRALAPRQFDDSFTVDAAVQLQALLGLQVPPALLRADWARPLDMSRLYAHCILGTFCQLMERGFERLGEHDSNGESASEWIQRWGFHAVDITPCADGRLSGVMDFILRVPPSMVAYRKSYAGALFDVEESLRHWETVELRRWREGRPNDAQSATRYLKIGVYHFSSTDPRHAGCAAHGSDTARAAEALADRLHDLERAVAQTHCCNASIATLLIGVDTDTDAIRLHVPDAAGRGAVNRWVDTLDLYSRSIGMAREAAKDFIRASVADCAGVPLDDAATEGMRWLCGYLAKNNIAQIDAVRAWHGGSYADRGHTERLIIVGDAIDDVQLRNLAFQAQMETVEEGAKDLDVGIHILGELNAARHLAIPILVHLRFDSRIPGARARAERRAARLKEAIENRYRPMIDRGALYVMAVLRAGQDSKGGGGLEQVTPVSGPGAEAHS